MTAPCSSQGPPARVDQRDTDWPERNPNWQKKHDWEEHPHRQRDDRQPTAVLLALSYPPAGEHFDPGELRPGRYRREPARANPIHLRLEIALTRTFWWS